MPLPVFRLPYMMKMPYDPLKDFTYIIHVTGYTWGVVVRSNSPWKTWKDIIDYAKANPGKFTYCSAGIGTTSHVVMERVALHDGIKWTYVPMKGSGESIVAVLGGHVNAQAEDSV